MGYLTVLGNMAYTALSDPGQFQPVPSEDGHAPLPRRSHKAWLYNLPIRRYDHYCRWLMNVIGLLNHRAFVTMCGGLVMLTLCSGLMDVGFVSRNELAYEWKENYHYVVFSEKYGTKVSVNDLSDDEFNDKFEQFEYDSSRNPFDRGLSSNCWTFWCRSRYDA